MMYLMYIFLKALDQFCICQYDNLIPNSIDYKYVLSTLEEADSFCKGWEISGRTGYTPKPDSQRESGGSRICETNSQVQPIRSFVVVAKFFEFMTILIDMFGKAIGNKIRIKKWFFLI